MRALVLEGGAMRGIFTAGVLDSLAVLDAPPFDLVIGVSAGACCAVSYLAGQVGRNRRIFVEQMTTREFADPLRALRGGSLVDMDFIMGPVTFLRDPLDLHALRASPVELEAVAAEAVTGQARYLPAQGRDCVGALLATVALPVFYRGGPVPFRGERLFDGGVVDPVPVGRALPPPRGLRRRAPAARRPACRGHPARGPAARGVRGAAFHVGPLLPRERLRHGASRGRRAPRRPGLRWAARAMIEPMRGRG
jgi:predicted patatin/cPLA2 family phospholipase